MKEFKVNEYISLRLESEQTVIYIKGKCFHHCKSLLYNVPVKEIKDYEDIQCIDDLESICENQTEKKIVIDPESEFWAYCSNIQAWAENDYDTCLLHREISISLLKNLTDVGDPVAKRVFKAEIAKSFETGNKNIFYYLLDQNYLGHYFSEEELITIYVNRIIHDGNLKSKSNPNLLEILINRFPMSSYYYYTEILYHILEKIKDKARIPFLNNIIRLFLNENLTVITFLIKEFVITEFTVDDFAYILQNINAKFLEIMFKIYIEEKKNYKGYWYLDNDFFRAYYWEIFEKLEKVDHSLLKSGIKNIIQEDSLNAIPFLLDLEVLETLNLKLLEELIKDKNIALIDKILEFLRNHNCFYGPREKQIDLFDKFNEIAHQNLTESIFETFKKKDVHNIAGFVDSNYFYYLKENELLSLVNSPDFDFMKLILETRKKFDEFEIDDSMYYFFESLLNRMRKPVIQKCIEIFENGTFEEINTLIKSGVLWYLTIEEFSPFIEISNSKVIKELLNLLEYNYVLEGLEYYLVEMKKDNPNIIKKFMKSIFLNCNDTALEQLLLSPLLYYITLEDVLDIFDKLPLEIQDKLREIENDK